jgi:tetratricopeptide (TPR) repeat protein/TolB-like protein
VLQRLTTALAGQYRVERELGEGGMATVYLAEDLKHHRPVAIKVLKPELAAALGSDRFLREIEIAARLQHPHILPVHDSGEADGLLYYVMPFVEGESLAARISREGGLPVDWSVRLLREAADALAYAHRKGLVHRDIKPDNILLSGNHALVADFGIARMIRDAGGATLTGTGVSLGTPTYMAPEQAAGEAVDQRADIYALGILAYEMLAGEPPFRGRTAQAVIGAHVSLPPTPITQHRPGLPPTLAATVMKCLEKHPADRFQSSDELLSALEQTVVTVGTVTPVGTVKTVTPVKTVAGEPTVPTVQRTALLFAAISVTVAGLTYGAMIALGLPSWVFPAAVALLLIGLPIVLTTQRVEQNRTPTALPHKLFNWKRAITGGVLAFGVLGAAVAAYMTMRSQGIGPFGTLVASGRLKEHPKVILADFIDNTGDSTLATAVTDAFRVDLGQSGAVELVQGAAIRDAFTRMQKERPRILSEEVARQLATREGIPAVVTGEINALGGGYVISARIIDAETGDVLVPLRETASDSSKIIPAVDKLSRKVRERIGESLRDIRETPELAQVTTASLPALRKYTQGRRAIEAGELDNGIALFKEAIALDTTFAAAYQGLYTGLGNVDLDRAVAADAREKAFRYRDRLTERERLKTEGSYYMNLDQFDQARAAYLELLGKDPDSLGVLNNLGIVELGQRKTEEALQWYERALAFQPMAPAANFNVVATSLDLGRVDRAREVRAQFESLRPGHRNGNALRWLIGWATGAYVMVDSTIGTMTAQGGSALEPLRISGATWLAGIRGQPSRMEALLAEGERRAAEGRATAEHVRTVAWVAMYQVVVQGKTTDALKRMDAALARFPLSSLQPVDRPYLEISQFYARAGRPVRARQLLADFQREGPKQFDLKTRQDLGLATAYATLSEGKAQDAIREFVVADVGQCKVCALPGLALAWQAAGNQDSVLAILERYATMPDDDRQSVDPLERAGAFARLGELYETKGDTARAVEWNAKFLELWKDADAEFKPVIERVRERQRRLTAEK